MTGFDDLDYLDASHLPQRRQHILAVIRDSVLAHGYPPSAREIADAVGVKSTSTVSKHLKALEEDGFLRRSAAVTRPIDVRLFLRHGPAPQSETSVSVPVVGDIAAGAPILAEQHADDLLTLPRELVGRGEVFALRVRGDSMIDAAICDGDLVVVRSQREANTGDIVAAMIGEEATVKVYRRRNGHVYLEPRNPAYSVIDGDEAVILGRVVSVMRRV
ncbi:transcriptional repressor LexA [Nocardia asteroides NBRC 15531]|uniref:transcriptional repressor LexA n=1 Tax=Nocardia asteroides TaxID=1824 RepID=UPI0004C280F4|nr:transcriptional repressor LexA [Nocardia asteroides]TLF63477.1 transcriptional repressor LexA [Nocardia asteroides NBRC 15531]UGT47076.1 transcriptional repressor LexA [Nocardia asteroides]